MKYTAVVFTPFLEASIQKGDTQEDAIKKACDCHKTLRGHQTYFTADGVVKMWQGGDSVNIGVVYNNGGK